MPDWQVLNRLNRWLRQWRNLAPWERRVLVGLACRLPLIWVLLHLCGFRRTHRFIEADTVSPRVEPVPGRCTPEDYAQRCAQLTEIAARHGFYRANCLQQSLTLCSFLRHMGFHAQLRIGVQTGSDSFQAHAWVELDGKSLGTSQGEYRVFPKLDTWNEFPCGHKY